MTAKKIVCLVTCALVSVTAPARAQDAAVESSDAASSANPITDSQRGFYDNFKAVILRSLEKIPDGQLDYKPVDTVRSYGQIVAHIADVNYALCGMAVEDSDRPEFGHFEKTATTRAALVEALERAFKYCDGVYDGMTDAVGSEMISTPFFGDQPRLGLLGFSNAHTWEHYGNLVTYMRMNDIVPPTSEPRGGGQE